jgi:hypothetical protein
MTTTKEEANKKFVCTTSKFFRLDKSESLHMTLGEWVVSFEGYTYEWDNEKTLGPKRGKKEFAGANLGLIKQCDFNSNDWWSPRYDFEKNGYYFDNSRGQYPFCPTEDWKGKGKYMLWEPEAWKKQGFGTSDNFWSAKGLMEESVWKQLTNPFNTTGSAKIIEDCELTREDLNLEKIYIYKEFDSEEKFNEAHKAEMVRELEEQIERIEAIPYGKGI